MTMIRARRLMAFSLLLAGVACSSLAAPVEPAPPVPGKGQIEEWVRQLGAPDFATREEATRELKKHPRALVAVREASQSSDAEVARRAVAILKVYGRLEAERTLPKIKAHVRDWEPDLFVERALRYGGDEDHVWQAATDLGYAAYELLVKRPLGNGKKRAWPSGLPGKDFAKDKRGGALRILSPDTRMVTDRGWYLFRGRSLTLGSCPNLGLAVVEDSLRATRLHHYAFVNGPVSIIDSPPLFPGMRKSSVLGGVMACDGDVNFPDLGKADVEGIGGVVVCNGTIRCPKSITGMILAAGDVHIPEGAKIQYAFIRAGGKIHLPKKYDVWDSDLIENAPDPTAPFKFFELSRVGLEIRTAVGGVWVEKIAEKKPFAAAGIQRGDLVTAVDGKKVESVAGFRKQVRAAFVQGDCTLTVRRGTETKEIAVRFPE